MRQRLRAARELMLRVAFAALAGLMLAALGAGVAAGEGAAAATRPAQAPVLAAAGTLTDQEYINQLHDRFGVSATDGRLEALLNSPSGYTLRWAVAAANYGDEVLKPTDVGVQAAQEVVSILLGVNDLPGPEAAKGELLDLGEALLRSEITDILQSGGVSTDLMQAASGASSALDFIDKAKEGVSFLKTWVSFRDKVTKYLSWGLEAQTDRDWRTVIRDYAELRKTHTIAQAQYEMLNGDLSPYYQEIFTIVTRDLVDTGWEFGDFLINLALPLGSKYATLDAMWGDLELSSEQLLAATDRATQARIGAAIDALAMIQAYSTDGLIGVQTASDTITLFNNGPSTVRNVSLTVGGTEVARTGDLAPYAWRTIDDEGGNSLKGSGQVRFDADGLLGLTRTLSQIRKLAWYDSVWVNQVSVDTWNYGVTGLAQEAGAGTTGRWMFGDGYTSSGGSAGHTYLCGGDYSPVFEVATSAGQVLRSSTKTLSIDYAFTPGWTLNNGSNGFVVAPGETATFRVTGVPEDPEIATVRWIVDGEEVTDRTFTRTFSGTGVHTVVLAATDVEAGCTLPGVLHYVSVGDQNTWVKLPDTLSGSNVMLGGGVAGYWSDRTVTIPAGSKVTIVGAVVKSSTSTLFDVFGQLDLANSTRLASMSDTSISGPPGGASTVPADFRFTAIKARPGSTIEVHNVIATGLSSLITATRAARVQVTESTITAADTAISVIDPKSVLVAENEFHGRSGSGTAVSATGIGELVDIPGNTFSGLSTGVQADGYTRVKVRDSHFDDTRVALRLFDGAIRSTVSGSIVSGHGTVVALSGMTVPGITSLSADLPYYPTGLIVPVGSTLVIPGGSLIKIPGNGYYPTNGFNVAGRLRAVGTAAAPVVFTAFADDSLGGDSDWATADMTSPRTWDNIPITIRGAGQVDVDGVQVVRCTYFVAAAPGDANASGWGTNAGTGGRVSITRSEITAIEGIYSRSSLGLVRVTDSTFTAGNSIDLTVGGGIVELAGNEQLPPVFIRDYAHVSITRNTIGQISLTGTTDTEVIGNQLTGAAQIYLSDGAMAAQVRDNVSTEGMGVSVYISGSTPNGTVRLDADAAYIPSVHVSSQSILELAPGTMYKMQGSGYLPQNGFSVRGELRVLGTTADPVVFTSYSDPTVGGDTSPGPDDGPIWSGAWNFTSLAIAGSGHIDVEHADVRGGSNFVAAAPGQANASGWGTEAGTGGIVEVRDSDVRTTYAAYVTAGLASLSIAGSNLHGGHVSVTNQSSINQTDTTAVEITDTDFGTGGGLSVTRVASLVADGNHLPAVVASEVQDVEVTDNVLGGTAAITLVGSSAGAIIHDNISADTDAPHVELQGQAGPGTTHLTADIPYVVGIFHVPSNSTVVIAPGSVIKTNTGWTSTQIGFSVAGTVQVAGTEANPVRFTSSMDDSIGGDTNFNGPDNGDARMWSFASFGIRQAGDLVVDHAVSSAGNIFVAAVPNTSGGWHTEAGAGGTITIRDSTLTSNQVVWTTADIASLTIERSTLRGGTPFQVTGTGTKATTVTIADTDLSNSVGSVNQIAAFDIRRSTFASVSADAVPAVVAIDNHLVGSERIDLRGTSMAATLTGNSALDGDGGSVRISGAAPSGSASLSSNLPFVIESALTVPVGSTLTFAPGQIVKVTGTTGFPFTAVSVAGTAFVAGTAGQPVIFTSLGDDSVGGDTDRTVANLSESRHWAFVPFGVSGAGSVTIDGARVLGGRYLVAAVPGSTSGSGYGTNAGTGGSVTIRDSVISSTYGLTSTARIGTATLTGNHFDRANVGLSIVNPDPAAQITFAQNRFTSTPTGVSLGTLASGVGVSITRNSFAGTTTGVTSTRAITARENWWGNAAGPGTPSAATASSAVDARPWCLDPACTTFSPVPATAIAPAAGAPTSAVVGTPIPGFAFQLTGPGSVEPTDVQFTLTGAAQFAGGPSTATARSGAGGLVAVPSILPSTQPGTAVLTARIGSSLSSSITLPVSPDVPAEIVAVSGGGERIDVGDAGNEAVVHVVDRYGNAIEPAAVLFSIQGSGLFDGGATSATVTTSAGDAASPAWSSNGVAGTIRITASAGGVEFAFPVAYAGELADTGGLVINELAPGWVELLNTDDLAIDAGGLSVTDDASGTAIPAGSIVAAGERLTVTLTAGHHLVATTRLVTSGDAAIDSVASSPTAGISWGRCPEGTGLVQPTLTPTPGAANDCPAAFATAPVPVIGVSGAPIVGQLLHATAGAWSPAADLTFQWLSDGFPIEGADAGSYRPQASDLGHVLSVAVTARAPDTMITERVSGDTAAVVPGTLAAGTTPRIIGALRSGSTISVTLGAWTPAPAFSYRWAADGATLPGATGPTLLLTSAQQAARITVTVTGHLAGYSDLALTSNATAPVLSAVPLSHGTPAISGKAAVGSTLVANPSTWTPAATLQYQWYANSAPISGATRDRFVVTSAELGKRITVRITGDAPGWPTTRAVSAATTPVVAGTFGRAPKPVLIGNGAIGTTLRVDTGLWSPMPTLSYQWYANGQAIPRATTAVFAVTQRQAGQKITVVVTATRSGYTTLKVTSAPRNVLPR